MMANSVDLIHILKKIMLLRNMFFLKFNKFCAKKIIIALRFNQIVPKTDEKACLKKLL